MLSSPAYAETRAEYDAVVAQAQSKVDTAQTNLGIALAELEAAKTLKLKISQSVIDANTIIGSNQFSLSEKNKALESAMSEVVIAQDNYDKKLIATTPEEVEQTILGLQADIYTFDPSNPYPNRVSSEHTFCKTITVDNIDKDWGGGNIEGCGEEFVIIHYTGFITVDKTDNYEFLAQVDDGWHMTIGDTVVNDNWVLKGCGGWWSQPINLEKGKSYPIDAWFYEYGGGACNQLLYLNTETWNIVPSSWFSQNKQAPIVYVKDPALLAVLEEVQLVYETSVLEYEKAQIDLSNATEQLSILFSKEIENQGKIDIALQNVTTKETELNVAKQELETVPPFREPTPPIEETEKPVEVPAEVVPKPLPEPVTPETTKPEPEPELPVAPELPVDISTVDPQTLSEEQVLAIISVANEILNNSEQGSPEYEEALKALFIAAQADDIVLSEELAAIPGAEALVGALNFIGNVGADMSPKVREESEKIVITAIVAVGAAVNAATGAAMVASAPSAGGASNNIRRKD